MIASTRDRLGAERLWSDPRVVDAALAVGVAALALFGTLMAAKGQPDARALDPLAVVLLAGGSLALAFRRSHPLAVLGAAMVTTFAYELLAYPAGPIWGALIVAFFTAHAAGHRVAAYVAAALGWTSVWWTAPISGLDPISIGEGIAFSAWMLLLVAGAEVVRVRRAYAEAARARTREVALARAEQARRRRSEERLRIAQELHDVLAHNISLMNVQASTALHLLDDDPQHARPALTAIKSASGEALGALRSVLDTLRGDERPAARTPAPGLAQLEQLVAQARAAGLAVELDTDGRPRALPAAVELAAFRICQEAVTNVLRHAGPARARVHVHYGEDELGVDIVDDGPGAPAGSASACGGGRGLPGMRERAAALGGSLDAGPRPAGGFEVHARLPVGSAG